jgi:antitoxin component of MazEF toxin-antitoxin module
VCRKEMSRFREVKKWGNSFVIALTSQDMEDLNLKIGDQVDLEDAMRKTSIPAELSFLSENQVDPRKEEKI